MAGLGLSTVPGLVAGTPASNHGSGRMRQPLQPPQHNTATNAIPFSGVGMSSNVKVSQAGGVAAGLTVPPGRPRGM